MQFFNKEKVFFRSGGRRQTALVSIVFACVVATGSLFARPVSAQSSLECRPGQTVEYRSSNLVICRDEGTVQSTLILDRGTFSFFMAPTTSSDIFVGMISGIDGQVIGCSWNMSPGFRGLVLREFVSDPCPEIASSSEAIIDLMWNIHLDRL
ncbi:MAG: hypothetical protein WBA57_20885 [Elainellaceae cyanobacterium]